MRIWVIARATRDDGFGRVTLAALSAMPHKPAAMSHYPALRLRRTRATAWSRRLHAETVLTPADLIWPLFVTEGQGVEEPIASLPGVSRWSVDGIVARAKEARDARHPVRRAVPQHARAPAQRRRRARRSIPTI